MDFFDSAYRGTPPWDIGRPQKEFTELVRHGEITGSVLDIGCGSGDNALFFAEEGFEVWGIDSSPLAIQKAREKGATTRSHGTFSVLNALELTRLNRTFDTATDSGLFHTLSDADRPLFAKSLAAVLSHKGTYFMLCFSDKEPGAMVREELQNGRSGRPSRTGGQSGISGRRRSKATPGPKDPCAWLTSIAKK